MTFYSIFHAPQIRGLGFVISQRRGQGKFSINGEEFIQIIGMEGLYKNKTSVLYNSSVSFFVKKKEDRGVFGVQCGGTNEGQ